MSSQTCWSLLDSLLKEGKIARFEKTALDIIQSPSSTPNEIYNAKLELSKLYMKLGLHEQSLNYLPKDQLLARTYQELFISSEHRQYPFEKVSSTTDRIAFVSTDWEDHPCSKFLKFVDRIPGSIKIIPDKDIITTLDSKKPTLIVDCNGLTKGTITNKLVEYSKQNQVRLVTYLGYPVQVEGIEYIEEEQFKLSSNKLERITNSFFLCYKPDKDTQIEPKSKHTEKVVYGYFARLEKTSDSVINHMIKIIHETLDKGQVPLIRARALYFFHSQVRKLFLSRIPEEYHQYFELEEYADKDQYYEQFNEIDYLIDSYPFSGTTITCDSLYMGIQILTNPEVKDTDSLHTTVTKRLIKYLGIEDEIDRNEIRSKFISKICNPIKFANDFVRALT